MNDYNQLVNRARMLVDDLGEMLPTLLLQATSQAEREALEDALESILALRRELQDALHLDVKELMES